ncbi:MAG: O-antigen ligase family protein [Psychroflexus halocasei]
MDLGLKVNNLMVKLTNEFVLKVSIWLILFSYFYNLPVMSYSIKGDNELRLYDFVGLIFFFFYFTNFKIINLAIKRVLYLRRFYTFLLYCSLMSILTLLIYTSKGRFLKFLQSFLYLYHMWVFFLGAVFMHYYITSKKVHKNISYYLIILIILSGLVVIFQNLGIIPFLWSNLYKLSYGGFLSGTFGPNKIVLGMTMLMSFGFLVGLLFSKKIIISKPIILLAIGITLICILYSGSRTTYVGLGVFLVYFLLTQTSRFVLFSIIGGFLGIILVSSLPKISEGIIDVIEYRIIGKISEPEEIDSIADTGKLYEDLGSGRDQLSIEYIKFILSNPRLLPFGQGFINRSGIGFSAHNMYLTMIVELGIVGLIIFLRWLFSYFRIKKRKQQSLQLAVNGIVASMMVTLLFGEHLYVYRPLFGLLGLFLIIFVILLYPLRKTSNKNVKRKI